MDSQDIGCLIERHQRRLSKNRKETETRRRAYEQRVRGRGREIPSRDNNGSTYTKIADVLSRVAHFIGLQTQSSVQLTKQSEEMARKMT